MVSNKITTSNPLRTPEAPTPQAPVPEWVGEGLAPNTVRVIRNAMVSFHGGMIQELGDAFSRELQELRKARPDHENHRLEGTPLWVQSREGGGEAWLPTDATKDLLSRLGRERLTKLVEEHADHVREFLERRHVDGSRRMVVLTPGVDGAFAWITDGEHRLLHIIPWPRAKDERRTSTQPQTRPWQLPARIGQSGQPEVADQDASEASTGAAKEPRTVPKLSSQWVHHLVMTGIEHSADHRDEEALRVERAQEYARAYRSRVDEHTEEQQQKAREANADRAADDRLNEEEAEENESDARRRDRLLQDRAKTVIPVDHKPDLELRDHEEPDGEPHLQKVEGVHRENPYHR